MDVFEFELPEGCAIRGPQTEEEAALLGATLDSPSPGGIFGGADVWSAQSADGWIYFVYCGERPGRSFGTHAFRVWPANGHTEWLELRSFTELRSTAGVEPNGAWLTYTNGPGNRVYRQQVPLFVTPGYPSSGKTAATPAPPPAAVIDEGARAYASAIKQELTATIKRLEGRIEALTRRVEALERRPNPSDQLTPGQIRSVRDVIWGPERDAVNVVYAEVIKPNSGLRQAIIAAAKAGK